MSWLQTLFARKAIVREHAIFGSITYSEGRGWRRDNFSFWGFQAVLLLIDAGPDGPTPEQEAAFLWLRNQQVEVLPRCLVEVESQRSQTMGAAEGLSLSGLSIPSLGTAGPARTGQLWTIWFDYDAEDHWSYGVQSDDAWRTIQGYAED
jgi:hypothetical protein